MSIGLNSPTSASNAMLHSFSALDIQKMRSNLKSSKSYPHDLKEKVNEEDEEDEEKKKDQPQQQQQDVVNNGNNNNNNSSAQAATQAPKAVKQVAASFAAKTEPATAAAASVPRPTSIAANVTAANEGTKKPETTLINVRIRFVFDVEHLT